MGKANFFFLAIGTKHYYLCYFVESVAAINNLYVSLGLPTLPGWVPNGGDPCGEVWQGVECNNTAIMKMYGNPFS